ncbi:hypothetical protein KJ365_05560 [Glaciecola sp. XM2]|jgi:hypothetical protein|uniref:hypothetical protein n=1 Tax=Glaciecola sp. XM2 TaxID=1914931 RepID=UPI001BDDD310|nr:hypothetical protein [Glaciecola sp. XM2]MBT1450341.1 hypothetical protein [Glaciecola sp. XM2]
MNQFKALFTAPRILVLILVTIATYALVLRLELSLASEPLRIVALYVGHALFWAAFFVLRDTKLNKQND